MAIIDVYKKKDPYSYDSVQKAQAEKDKYNTYTASDSVTNADKLRNEADSKLQSHANSWNTDIMSKDYLEAYDTWQNRPDFSYDVNGDALYQQYKDQYINQGRLAMMDTMGQAAAMTGGYGNSYAATVGNQAYQGYLQKLNEVVPELYNMAYNMYQQEGEDLRYAYESKKDEYKTKYGEWADMLGFLQSDASRRDANYYNEANLDWSKFDSNRTYTTNEFNTALDWATNNENTLFNDAFAMYQQSVQEDQWNKDYALNERSVKASETAAANANKSAELEAKYEGWISPDEQKAGTSKAVKTFDASILTESEFKRRGKSTTINGKSKRFDNYGQYVSAVLEQWYNNGQLTENEVAYIAKTRGITE